MKQRDYADRPVGYARYRFKTTPELARALGVSPSTLWKWIQKRKITAPKPVKAGKRRIRYWTTKDIKRVKKELKRK